MWRLAKAAARSGRETKFITTTRDAVVDDGGVVTHLSAIASGNLREADRIGERVFLKTVEIRGNIVNQSGTEADTHEARMILFQDWHNDGTNPSVADILDTTVPNSHRSQGAEDMVRFKILRDTFVTLAPRASTRTGDPTIHTFHHWIPINREVRFTGSAGSDTGPGCVFILMLTNDPATSTVKFTWNSLVRYQDA